MSCTEGVGLPGGPPPASWSRRAVVGMAPAAVAVALAGGRAPGAASRPASATGHMPRDVAGPAAGDPVAVSGFAGAHLAVWSPDSCHIAGTDCSVVRVWSAAGDLTAEYTGHTEEVLGVAWAPDGRRLASAGFDGTAHVWAASGGQTLLVYRTHDGWVRDVQWAPSGRWLASAGYDRTVRVWDAQTGATVAVSSGHDDDICALAWSPDGRRVASTDLSGVTQIWAMA